MNDRAWANRVGDPFSPQGDPFDPSDEEDGYQPWRCSNAGWVRDLKCVPAKGSGEPVRFEPYMQAISIELNAQQTQLCLMCHTSGQMIFIEGGGLEELAELISAKRVQSIHVWSEAEVGGAPPAKVVTTVRFEKRFEERSG